MYKKTEALNRHFKARSGDFHITNRKQFVCVLK